MIDTIPFHWKNFHFNSIFDTSLTTTKSLTVELDFFHYVHMTIVEYKLRSEMKEEEKEKRKKNTKKIKTR